LARALYMVELSMPLELLWAFPEVDETERVTAAFVPIALSVTCVTYILKQKPIEFAFYNSKRFIRLASWPNCAQTTDKRQQRSSRFRPVSSRQPSKGSRELALVRAQWTEFCSFFYLAATRSQRIGLSLIFSWYRCWTNKWGDVSQTRFTVWLGCGTRRWPAWTTILGWQ
jgi:hypothetical protein